jgi:protease-4
MSENDSATPDEPVVAAAQQPDLPPVPPSPARRGHPVFWIFLGLAVVLFVVMSIFATAISMIGSEPGVNTSRWFPGAKVGIVPIEGEIYEAQGTIEELRRYAENDAVKAIVVRINSPGGAIVPSQEIFAEIRRIRAESGKPIVASLDSVAASGGYYIAAACDRIVANPGSITGSIGVILQWLNLEDLVRWAKMRPETLTSGALKDTGSPYRQMTPAERAYLQSIVSQLHRQFVKAVAEGRKGKLSEAEVARLADGRIFTGEEARTLRLVDDLGNLHDAVMLAGDLAGLEGEPDTIYPRREEEGLLDMLVGSSRAERVINRLLSEKPQILYRW